MKIMCVFGTRPEAVKMCPLVKELKRTKGIECVVCLTGQHRQMLKQVMDIFEIQADYNLDIMQPSQTLTTITTSILSRLEEVLCEERPELVLVHGDTTTSFAAALAAFYQQIPVGHVEAGLRTFDKYSPFPEEMNRSLTGRIAELHFAPTRKNEENLKRESITRNIFVTGNTVIDAFATTVQADYVFKNEELQKLDFSGRKILLVTAHRRENLGKPLEQICRALRRIAEDNNDIDVIYPVHLNPAVHDTVYRILDGMEQIHLTEPLDVADMHNLMAKSCLVLTDSGGLQEEAPSLGIPVLVLRTETERPEAVEAGTVRVTGVDEDAIYLETMLLLRDAEEYEKMARAVNPYGDGHASRRIAEAIRGWYDLDVRKGTLCQTKQNEKTM